MSISAVNHNMQSDAMSLLEQNSNGFDESTMQLGGANESDVNMFEKALHAGLDPVNEASSNIQSIVKSGPLTPDKMLALEENTKSYVTQASLLIGTVKVVNNFVKEMTHIQ